MAYIGKDPAEAYQSFVKQDFSVSATTSYTLSQAVNNENEIALFINFVRQEPTTAYTASGTSLTLTSATASGDDMYCVYLGMAKQTINPSDGSVGSSQVASTIITGQTAETSIATDDTVLIHDTSAGALRKMTRANFVSGIGGTNTPAFSAYAASQTLSDQTSTALVFGTELYDTNSAYDASNGRFTVPSGEAGKYFFHTKYRIENDTGYIQVEFRKNGSEHIGGASREENGYSSQRYISVATSFSDSLSVGDYIEAYAYMSVGNTNAVVHLTFTGFKIIE